MRSLQHFILLIHNMNHNVKELNLLKIDQLVTFVKSYTEHILTKTGTVCKIEGNIVYIQTDPSTIYKVVFSDATFYVGAEFL